MDILIHSSKISNHVNYVWKFFYSARDGISGVDMQTALLPFNACIPSFPTNIARPMSAKDVNPRNKFGFGAVKKLYACQPKAPIVVITIKMAG